MTKLHQNKTFAKGSIKDNSISFGTVRPLAYLEMDEVVHLVDNVGTLADRYNDIIGEQFGLEIYIYEP